jgi:hypothetical protein
VAEIAIHQIKPHELVLGILSIEPFDTSGGIDQFLLSGEERMTLGADFQVDLRFGRTGLKRLTACALNGRFDVSRMNIRLHDASQSNQQLYDQSRVRDRPNFPLSLRRTPATERLTPPLPAHILVGHH